jgi:peroxiredoxin
MSASKKWLITLAISLAVVLGYAAALVAHRPRPEATQPAVVRAVPELRGHEGKPLPDVDLIAPDNTRLDDAALRKGKVMLVLLTSACPACKREGEFLRSVVGKRNDINFYGVNSFEQDEESMKKAETLFPFKVYRDSGMKLAGTLDLGRVPIKIYLEDGIIKRSWDGASADEQSQEEFTSWLSSLNPG